MVRYPMRPILAPDAPQRASSLGLGRSASAPRASGARTPVAGRSRSPAGAAAAAGGRRSARGPPPAPQRARSLSPGARDCLPPGEAGCEGGPAAAAASRLYEHAFTARARREQLVHSALAAERDAREWVAPDSARGVAPRVYQPPSRGRSPERVPRGGAYGARHAARAGVGGWA
jgi:hypothetical protein